MTNHTRLIRPYVAGLALRSDGSLGLVDSVGQPMPDDAEIVVTAGVLTQHLVDHVTAGLKVGRKLGVKAAADVGAQVVQAAAKASAHAGMVAGAKAGVDAGAKFAMESTRKRHEIVRDADGRIVASLETREPIPSTTEGKT